MTLWGFLAAAVGPLAIKILIALGISAVTFIGVDTVSAQLKLSPTRFLPKKLV